MTTHPTQAEQGLKAFVESLVDAAGPYPFLNGTQVVADAYRVLESTRSPYAAASGTETPVCPQTEAAQEEAIKLLCQYFHIRRWDRDGNEMVVRVVSPFTRAETETLVGRVRTLEEALENISASASDAGNSEGKEGAAWVAARCRELSLAALGKHHD
jgi:hypothetical protein